MKLTLSDRPIRKRHYWFVSETGTTQLCIRDPGFDVNLYLTTTLPDMIYVWRGDIPLSQALDEGRMEMAGDFWARRAFPRWLARSSYADVKSVRPVAGIAPSNQRKARTNKSRNEHLVAAQA